MMSGCDLFDNPSRVPISKIDNTQISSKVDSFEKCVIATEIDEKRFKMVGLSGSYWCNAFGSVASFSNGDGEIHSLRKFQFLSIEHDNEEFIRKIRNDIFNKYGKTKEYKTENSISWIWSQSDHPRYFKIDISKGDYSKSEFVMILQDPNIINKYKIEQNIRQLNLK